MKNKIYHRKFAAFLVSLISFACTTKKENYSVMNYFPSNKNDLSVQGFKNGKDEVFFRKKSGDTIVYFFYPEYNYYEKEIIFPLKKFDSTQLTSWFKKLDNSCEFPSPALKMIDSRGIQRIYKVGTRSGAMVLIYTFGKRDAGLNDTMPIAEEERDALENK